MIQLLSDPKMRTYSNATCTYATMGGIAQPYQPMMPAAAMRPAAHHYIPPMAGITATVPTSTVKSNPTVQTSAYSMVCEYNSYIT